LGINIADHFREATKMVVERYVVSDEEL